MDELFAFDPTARAEVGRLKVAIVQVNRNQGRDMPVNRGRVRPGGQP